MDDFARRPFLHLASTSTPEVPEELRSFVEASVSKSREVFDIWAKAGEANAKTLGDIQHLTQSAATTIVEKVAANARSNAEAVFDAAEKLAKAKSLTEAYDVQTRVAQAQIVALTAQSKELFELGVRLGKDIQDAWVKSVSKSSGFLKAA